MENEYYSFQPRKYLLSMKVGIPRTVQSRVCKYESIKSVASQLKRDGLGVWKVSKKVNGGIHIRIEREK
jgi:hypothetical protein